MTIIDKTIFEAISKGEVIDLGQNLQPGIPHHPFHPPFLYSMGRMHNDLAFENEVSSANDFIATGTHTGTHIDALGHFSCLGALHGDVDAEASQTKGTGLSENSIDKVPPLIKRGVLLDVAGYKGESVLDHAYGITKEDVIETAKKQGTTIQEGDAVFIRTGWAQYFNQPRLYISPKDGVPGITEEAAKWLVSEGMRLTGSDTVAYEQCPTNAFPVHNYLLVKEGIHIIEVMDLEGLAEKQAYEFLFIAIPLKIVGGTGSPIRPVAII